MQTHHLLPSYIFNHQLRERSAAMCVLIDGVTDIYRLTLLDFLEEIMPAKSDTGQMLICCTIRHLQLYMSEPFTHEPAVTRIHHISGKKQGVLIFRTKRIKQVNPLNQLRSNV